MQHEILGTWLNSIFANYSRQKSWMIIFIPNLIAKRSAIRCRIYIAEMCGMLNFRKLLQKNLLFTVYWLFQFTPLRYSCHCTHMLDCDSAGACCKFCRFKQRFALWQCHTYSSAESITGTCRVKCFGFYYRYQYRLFPVFTNKRTIWTIDCFCSSLKVF